MSWYPKAPMAIEAFADADSRSAEDGLWRLSLGIAPEAERRFAYFLPIQRTIDSQGRAKAPRPAANFRFLRLASAQHLIASEKRFDSPDQDGFAAAQVTAAEIKTKMHAIDEVNVNRSRIQEHRAIASALTAKGMTRRIVLRIGFCFADRTTDPTLLFPKQEMATEEVAGKEMRIFCKKIPLQWDPLIGDFN